MNRLLTIVDSKYQRLEYLEFTGTQYIDTGYKANNNTRVITEISTKDVTQNQFIFCCRNYSDYKLFNCLITSSKIRADYSSTATQTITITNDTFYKIDFNKNNFYIDGNLETTFAEATFQVDYNMLLGASSVLGASIGNFFKGKMKYEQIYDNGTLVRNFIPVLRKTDNELGMLDLVEGKFYGNAGTGKFTANLDTMYAIIQGSPTIQDGRVSNFSNSNYLQINQAIDFSKDVEIALKTHTDTIRTTQYPMSWVNSSNYPSGLFVGYFNSANERYGINIRKESNTDEFVVAGSPNLQNDTDVWFKFVWDSTNKVVKYGESYDGVNYRFGVNRTLTENFANAIKIIIGNFGGSNPFNGSIDLNRSYIKLGSTKYKLQAVVGYTVVGSPTISDGVVSGFSSANYLQTSSNYTINNMNNDDYEFCIKFTPTSSMGSECYAIKYYNGSTVKGLGISNNKLAWSVGYPTTSGHKGTILSSFTVTTNTTYWLKGIYKNKIASLYYSLDGTNYTLIESIDETDQTFKITSGFNFGATAGSSYGLFQGSIDMKETYIKINNKLWFNGQEG